MSGPVNAIEIRGVIVGKVPGPLTPKVADKLVIEAEGLVTCTLYCPAWNGCTFVRVNLVAVAPAIGRLLRNH